MIVRNCNRCGAAITFVRTTAGRAMPCDAQAMPYRQDPGGPENIMTPDGRLVRGHWLPGGTGDGVGYRPHWASCRAKGRTAINKPMKPCGRS